MVPLSLVLILIGAAIAMYIAIEGRWKSKNFWKQQFNSKVTEGQVAFDITLGVIMPVLCLVLDPVVFRNQFPYGQSILYPIRIFGYTSIALGIVALSLWLLLSKYLNWASAFLAGIFFYGAFFALLLGILIFPFGVIGLLGLVGVLGFTPFLSSFVYLRKRVRAYRQVNEQSESTWKRRISILLGVVSIVLIPTLAQALNLFSFTTSS